MKEELVNKAKEIAKQYENELKQKVGDLYEKHKNKIGYFVEELAYCKAMVVMGVADDNVKEDLENLLIGIESVSNSIIYETSKEGVNLFKELFAVACKMVIQTTLASLKVA